MLETAMLLKKNKAFNSRGLPWIISQQYDNHSYAFICISWTSEENTRASQMLLSRCTHSPTKTLYTFKMLTTLWRKEL